MRLPDEMIDQGALDLRALGFNVDSNARPAPAAAETTPVLDALDAAIARAGGEPPPPEPEAPLGGDRTERIAVAAAPAAARTHAGARQVRGARRQAPLAAAAAQTEDAAAKHA